ncbi:MAG: peptide-methionine (R)-S-oxide reductase MsrB [Flavobacteriales bacterium]|jgi:peptide-methionine (R)-S-oxide reductase|tara:strand:+ start:1225 stop:1611 length:387 start_codon:yes stop_codon:yes gene_type:complete
MTTFNKDWKKELSDEEYRVMREKGTERPFTGEYYIHNDNGIYKCKGCAETLFSSSSKFDTGCGWPSFDEEIKVGKIKEISDKTLGMIRTEIVCANCDTHLGHVFNDGPSESGLRYCVNSISLDFDKKG